jgi:hypothetical protein
MYHGWLLFLPPFPSLLILSTLVLPAVVWPRAACAGSQFEIVDQSVRVDSVGQRTTFHITFNQKPDFFTIDEFGRPRNEFQYYVDSAPLAVDDFDFSSDRLRIIRGGEIHVDDTIPVRQANGNSPDPTSGGWGPTVGAAPYALDGETLSFTIPWKWLGETDGKFTYIVESYEFGSTVSSQRVLVIPLPAPVWGGAALLGVAGVILARREMS